MAKIEVVTKQPPFEPVVLTVTLESQEEVDALWGIGNNGNAHNFLPFVRTQNNGRVNADKIRKVTSIFYKALSSLRTPA